MATGRPAGADLQEHGVVAGANVNRPRNTLRLRMAAETQVVVGLGEHHAVDRAVRIVTGDAALAQGGMLEDKGTRLLAMALGTGFVRLRHGQPAGRFVNVFAVRVVALDTVHVSFDDRMMHGQLKFRPRGKVATQAGVRGLPRIDDESADAAAGLDMFAARAVTGFTAGAVLQVDVFQSQMGVRAGFEFADDVGVALKANMVAHVMRAGNLKRCDHCRWHGGT